MDRASIYDELSRIEREVVAGERQLAEQERLVLDLRREGQDSTSGGKELEPLHACQRARDQAVNSFCHSCSPNRYKTPVEFHFERRIRLVPVTEAEQR